MAFVLAESLSGTGERRLDEFPPTSCQGDGRGETLVPERPRLVPCAFYDLSGRLIVEVAGQSAKRRSASP